jgi:hypothetical protein
MAKSVSFNLQKFMQDGEIDRLKTQIETGFKLEEGPFTKGLDQALKIFMCSVKPIMVAHL